MGLLRAIVSYALAGVIVGCAPTPPLDSTSVSSVPLKDGVYIGYEGMSNLSPEEDPNAYWYHRNVFRVTGFSVRLEQSPMYRSRGAVVSSSSDGGFPMFEGRIEQVGARTIVRLRKMRCDYCAELLDDPLPSRIEREYVLRFMPDGSFEMDRVIYDTKPNPSLEPTGS